MIVATLRYARRLVAAAPRSAFAVLCFGLCETLNAVLFRIPPEWMHILPWINRLATSLVLVIGLVLIRCACRVSAYGAASRIKRGAADRRPSGEHALADREVGAMTD